MGNGGRFQIYEVGNNACPHPRGLEKDSMRGENTVSFYT